MQKYPNGDKVTKKNAEKGNSGEIKLPECDGVSRIYLSSGLQVQGIELSDGVFSVYASSSSEEATCPYCGHKSWKVHSRYVRTIQDLSILGRNVIIHLEVRKFFCHNHQCEKKTFAEQPGNEVFRYRRRTCRCERAVARHGLSISSNSASELLGHLGVHISPSTILRDLHRIPIPSYPDVSQIGVDDWAFRKGISYGSVIVNLSTGMIIDLLEDRKEDTFKDWLDRHEKVSLVSRDRSTDYSSAIASTKRPIEEVADHFHLVKNASDMLTRVISENYEDYRHLVTGERKANDTSRGTNVLRKSKFDQVKSLQAKGMTAGEIAKATGIFYDTVKMYMGLKTLPAHKSNTQVDFSAWQAYVEKEYAKGRSLSSIFKEINKDGQYKSNGSYYRYFHYLSDGHRGPRKASELHVQAERVKHFSHTAPLLPIHMISSIVDKSIRRRKLDEREENLLCKLLSLDWFSTIYHAASEFRMLLKSGNLNRLDRWILDYEHASIELLRRFVYGIKRDLKAVRNCITSPVSNGIVEGFVNKIKEVKRVMFGRASLNLLKRKLIMEPLLFN